MLETPHVLVALAIATKIPNPFISLPLAFASHLAFEGLPHWNPHINTEKRKFGKITKNSLTIIVADSAFALILGTIISSQQLPDLNKFLIFMSACFMSVLPDLIEAPYYFMNLNSGFIKDKWIPFKKSLQVDTSPILGIATQFVVSILALWVILK